MKSASDQEDGQYRRQCYQADWSVTVPMEKRKSEEKLTFFDAVQKLGAKQAL